MNSLKHVPCEVYTRVVGYFRPVSQWNKGKQEEYAERRLYHISHIEEERYDPRHKELRGA